MHCFCDYIPDALKLLEITSKFRLVAMFRTLFPLPKLRMHESLPTLLHLHSLQFFFIHLRSSCLVRTVNKVLSSVPVSRVAPGWKCIRWPELEADHSPALLSRYKVLGAALTLLLYKFISRCLCLYVQSLRIVP